MGLSAKFGNITDIKLSGVILTRDMSFDIIQDGGLVELLSVSVS